MASKEQKFYVDVPGAAWLPDYDGHWKNCLTGVTKAEALAWIRENIGDCDDEGRICLLVGMGDDGDNDDDEASDDEASDDEASDDEASDDDTSDDDTSDDEDRKSVV
jgi:nucleosome binding factor SPN SPT16 subunit